MATMYVDRSEHIAQTGNIIMLDYLKYSPDSKYLVLVSVDDVSLVSRSAFVWQGNNYRLLQISGQKPFFSPDGRYIYSICGKHLESWFIDIETIAGIALDFFHNEWVW
jgi:hypothetical protein